MKKSNTQRAYQVYQQKQGEAPDAQKERLLRLYALAIRAAEERRRDDLHCCLSILRTGLNPAAAPELALSLMAFYCDVGRAADQGDFSGAAHLLESIKGLWEARARLDAARIVSNSAA